MPSVADFEMFCRAVPSKYPYVLYFLCKLGGYGQGGSSGLKGDKKSVLIWTSGLQCHVSEVDAGGS